MSQQSKNGGFVVATTIKSTTGAHSEVRENGFRLKPFAGFFGLDGKPSEPNESAVVFAAFPGYETSYRRGTDERPVFVLAPFNREGGGPGGWATCGFVAVHLVRFGDMLEPVVTTGYVGDRIEDGALSLSGNAANNGMYAATLRSHLAPIMASAYGCPSEGTAFTLEMRDGLEEVTNFLRSLQSNGRPLFFAVNIAEENARTEKNGTKFIAQAGGETFTPTVVQRGGRGRTQQRGTVGAGAAASTTSVAEARRKMEEARARARG